MTKEVLALDEEYMELQRMRTFVNLMPGDTGPRTVHYAADVQSIFDKRCIGCHGDQNPKGELALTGEPTTLWNRSYENLINKKLISHLNGGFHQDRHLDRCERPVLRHPPRQEESQVERRTRLPAAAVGREMNHGIMEGKEAEGFVEYDIDDVIPEEIPNMRFVRFSWPLTVLVVTTLASFCAAGGEEASWPAWRGPNRDSKSPDTGLLKSWPRGGPEKLWEVKGIGNGYSSVTLDGGLVYITGRKPHADEKIEYEEPPKHIWQIKGQGFYVTTIDDATGKVKQCKDVANAYYEKIRPDGRHENLSYKGTRASITIEEDRLYIATGLGEIMCLKKDNFERIWTRKVGEEEFDSGVVGHGWGYAESVLIYKDKAIYCTGGEKTFMVALDKMTGKTLWKSPPNGQSQYGSTIFADVDGAPMLVNGSRVGLMGVHAETGDELWRYEFAKGSLANCNTPIYSDGFVFWPCGYAKGGICLKMTANGQKVNATKAWHTKDADCHHGGMILHEGYLYGNNKSGFVCIDFKTGKTVWDSRDVDKDAETIPKGSVFWADDMFYVFAEKAGEMFLCECTPKGFKIKGHFFAEGFADESGWTKEYDRTMGPSWAHPVVAGGRLYLRHFNKVYCYDVEKK